MVDLFGRFKKKSELEKALDKAENLRGVVLGDVILDKFSEGKVSKINPEQPAATNIDIFEDLDSYHLGGAANVANNVSSLGTGCRLYGVIGKDEDGKKIERLCRESNISFVPYHVRKRTSMKWRTWAHGQQTQRMNFGEGEENLGSQIKKDLISSLEITINKADFIILSDYDKGFFTKELAQEIIKLGNLYNIPTHVDPKINIIENKEKIFWFKGCTVISPNEIEAGELTGIKYENGKETLLKMAKSLAEKVQSKYVIITCGADGVFAYDTTTQKNLMVPTKAREVYDVTGAGDTFAATVPIGLAAGLSLFEAVELANYRSAVVVVKRGTATANKEETISMIGAA